MKKRLLSLMLALAMVLGMVPTAALAAGPVQYTQADIIKGAWLTWDVIANGNEQTEVTGNLSLVESDKKPDTEKYNSGAYNGNAADVTWESSDDAVISIDDTTHQGIITRPAYGTPDVEVTLTATITQSSSFDIFAVMIGKLPEGDYLLESDTVEFDVTVKAAEPAVYTDPVDVTVMVQQEGYFWKMPVTLSVSGELSEEYGLTTEETVYKPTALDALIAVHKVMFDTEFTKDTVGDYLQVVASSGFVTKTLGEETTSFSFAINNECPNDGVINPDYGTYTGYSVTQAELATDDVVSFFFYDADANWGDYFVYFDKTKYEVEANEDLTVNLEGYSFMNDGCSPYLNPKKIEGVKIATVDESGSLVETSFTTDENGNAIVSFDQAGEYTISAVGKVDIGYSVPIVCPIATVTVTAPTPPANTKPITFTMESAISAVKVDMDTTEGEDWVTVNVTDTYYLPANTTFDFKATLDNGDVTGSITTKAMIPSFVGSNDQTFAFNYTKISANDEWTTADYTVTIKESQNAPVVVEDGYEFVWTNSTITPTIVPSEAKKAEGFVNTKLVTLLGSTEVDYFNPSEKNTIQITCEIPAADGDADTFTIPEGAILFVGKKGFKHFAPFTEIIPTSSDETTVKFDLDEGQYNYRLTQDGKITQTSTFTKSDAEFVNIVLTEKDADITTLGEEESNIFLNINATNELSLNTGDSKYLIPMRTPQAQVGSVDNYFLEPDFNYDITVLEGENPISIDGCTLTANSAGVAIVTVSYDAMYAFDQVYGALPGVNTGVFVVDVDGGDVTTNIIHDNEVESIYFTSENTEYTFTPATGSTVSYLNPTVTANGATYGKTFTDATITDGEATVTLTNGRNIIKVAKDGVASYHVISARKTEIVMKDATGATVTSAAPGEEITVTMSNISTPLPKLACIYNFYNQMEYTDGAETFNNRKGYELPNTIKITIPQDFTGTTYDLTGAVRVTNFGSSVGAHHDITEVGVDTNMNAPSVNALYGTLPAISIPVDVDAAATEFVDVKVSFFDGEQFLPMNGSIVAEVKTYAGQALDKGFVDVAEQAPGIVSYFDAMLAWQMEKDSLQDAAIEDLKEKIDFNVGQYGAEMTKFNGTASTNMNFMTNGVSNGFSVDNCPVVTDDHLTISFWKDSDYSNNVTPYYTQDSETITSLDAKIGEDIAVTMEYGYYDASDNWAFKTAPVADAQLATVNLETGVLTVLDDVKTAADGEFTLNFDTAGTYTVAPISGEGQDIYPALLTVTVTKTSGGGTVTPDQDSVTVKIYGVEDSVEEGDAIFKTSKSKFSLWADETVEISSGDKVLDALESTFEACDLDFENAGGSYIYSVEGLAEMGRGPASGWKYTLNGKYPTKGIDEQSIKDGDAIVLHYTDDYSQEADYEDQTGGSTGGATGGGSGTTEPETAVPEEEETTVPTFVDVAQDVWFAEAVNFVVEAGLFKGVSDTEFAPDANTTRASIWTVLARRAGIDTTPAEGQAWYQLALDWAIENGISDGTGADGNITREQLAVMLYRAALAQDEDVSVGENTNILSYNDAFGVSEWAMDAIQWACGAQILKGDDQGNLNPQGNATRAEVAAMMMRYLSK